MRRHEGEGRRRREIRSLLAASSRGIIVSCGEPGCGHVAILFYSESQGRVQREPRPGSARANAITWLARHRSRRPSHSWLPGRGLARIGKVPERSQGTAAWFRGSWSGNPLEVNRQKTKPGDSRFWVKREVQANNTMILLWIGARIACRFLPEFESLAAPA